jgi:hypothetical protein
VTQIVAHGRGESDAADLVKLRRVEAHAHLDATRAPLDLDRGARWAGCTGH